MMAAIAGCHRPRAESRAEPAASADDPRSPEQRRLEETLAKTPCDRGATIDLSTLLLEVDANAAIEKTATYLDRCGEDVHVRQIKFWGHSRLHRWDAALVEASTLVTLVPGDPNYRIERGEVYEELGQYESAADDYREALARDPASNDAPLKLANVYVRQGRACEATKMLSRSLAQRSEPRTRRPLEDRLAELAADEPCDSRAPHVAARSKTRPKTKSASPSEPVNAMPVNLTPRDSEPARSWEREPEKPVAESAYANGKAVVRYTPGRVAHANVLLNGQVRLNMIVDTGASTIAIPRRVAEKLGLAVDSLPTAQVSTAGGLRTARRSKLTEVRLQGVVAQNVPCIIVDDKDMSGEGLLGQSFLGRFKTTQDAKRGVIEIGD